VPFIPFVMSCRIATNSIDSRTSFFTRHADKSHKDPTVPVFDGNHLIKLRFMQPPPYTLSSGSPMTNGVELMAKVIRTYTHACLHTTRRHTKIHCMHCISFTLMVGPSPCAPFRQQEAHRGPGLQPAQSHPHTRHTAA
jgi:hypothetical protein